MLTEKDLILIDARSRIGYTHEQDVLRDIQDLLTEVRYLKKSISDVAPFLALHGIEGFDYVCPRCGNVQSEYVRPCDKCGRSMTLQSGGVIVSEDK